MDIKSALEKLNVKEAKDWTENGSPSLNRIRILMKNSDITQEALDEAANGMKRPTDAGIAKIKKAQAGRDIATEDDLKTLIDPETGRFDLMETKPFKDRETGEMVTREVRKKVFVKNMLIAAADRGFAHGSIRDPGDTFMFTGELGTWMMPGNHARVAEVRAAYALEREESLKPTPIPAAVA